MSNDFIKNEIANELRSESSENEAVIKQNDSFTSRSDSTETGNTFPTNLEAMDDSKESTETKIERGEDDESLNGIDEKKNEWVDILGSGGIMKKTIIEGKPGTQPTRTEKCTINYTCSLEDGTVVDTKANFSFFLGESDVISGLDVSIALLNIGEKCLLKIEPRLAFGKIGLPPLIPPDAIVLYEIELVSVEPEDEIENLTLQERQMTGNKKRERGNWWYTRGENNLAIQCYRKALDYLDEVETNTYSEEGQKTQI